MSKPSTKYEQAYAELTRPNGDFEAGLWLIESAVAEGDPIAEYALSTLYLDGREPHVAVDKLKGIALLKSAAAANVADAQFELAICYERGEELQKDDRLAFEW